MRLLLFDIDGTLISSGGAGRAAMAAAFSEDYGLPSPLAGVTISGRTDRTIFEDVLDRAGITAEAGAVDRMIASYLAHLPEALRSHRGCVLDGVADLLDALDRSAATIGLASGNAARGAELKLRHFGLWERFRGGAFGDAFVERADVIACAIDALGRAAGLNGAVPSTIVIGDTPRDVSAAHVAGARVLAVATGDYDEDALRASGADFVLPDLRDTEAALAILLG